MRNQLSNLLQYYLKQRKNLKIIYILIDCKVGIKNIDIDVFDVISNNNISFKVILTKTDKVSSSNLDKIINNTELEIKNYPAARPEIISTSARQKIGIEKIREQLNLIVNSSNVSKE